MKIGNREGNIYCAGDIHAHECNLGPYTLLIFIHEEGSISVMLNNIAKECLGPIHKFFQFSANERLHTTIEFEDISDYFT
jgi:hypothetical protein